MAQGERAKLYIAGFKGYGKEGFPAWGYPNNIIVRGSASFLLYAII